LHINYLSNAPESRIELITKLKNAKCAVDDGGSDWLTTGNFTIDVDEEAEDG
jgi:hypothetical protein